MYDVNNLSIARKDEENYHSTFYPLILHNMIAPLRFQNVYYYLIDFT